MWIEATDLTHLERDYRFGKIQDESHICLIFNADAEQPIRMGYYDFEDNEWVECHYDIAYPAEITHYMNIPEPPVK